MATPEGKIKAGLDKMLKGEKIWFFSPQAGPYGVIGIPDRIAIVCGLFVGIECKAGASKKMTATQELRSKQIEQAGGKFFLVYDKETIELVRRYIQDVRSGCSRQTGGSCCVAGSRCDTQRHTNSEASTG